MLKFRNKIINFIAILLKACALLLSLSIFLTSFFLHFSSCGALRSLAEGGAALCLALAEPGGAQAPPRKQEEEGRQVLRSEG